MPVRLTPRTLTLSRRIVVFATALLAVAVTLGGCTTLEKARSAAIVNGTSISNSEVAEVTQQYNDNLATSTSDRIQESQTLGLLILAPFVLGQVQKSGSWTPDARYNAAVDKIPGATQATKNLIATSIVLRPGVMSDQDVTVILDQLKSAKVELDPRYGTFDPTTGGFLAPDQNWIRPTAAPGDGGTSTSSPSGSPTEGSTATEGSTGTATQSPGPTATAP